MEALSKKAETLLSVLTSMMDGGRRELLCGVPLVMHDVLSEEEDELFFDGVVALVDAKPERLGVALDFVGAWVESGRWLRGPLKEKMKAWAAGQAESVAERAPCVAKIEQGIEDYSPVLGRWRSENSPRSNVFFWLGRSPRQVALALTAMCLPFYRLRACEFNEKAPGKHLKDLNARYNSVAKFISASVLSAAVASKKQGIAAMERWLETGERLWELQNYHMLFALQNALAKHQVDRLSFLQKGLAKKQRKFKKKLDDFFNANNRMKLFLAEFDQKRGHEPLIPCVFWMYQKATLLTETPLWTDDGSFNEQRVTNALKIFSDVTAMQKQRYAPLKEEEQILWYLMRLERDDLCSDDELYVLSDAAKKQSSRFQVGSHLGAIEKQSSAKKKKERKPTKRRNSDVVWQRRKASAGGLSESEHSEGLDSGSTRNSETSEETFEPRDDVPVFSLANILEMANGAVSGKADAEFLKATERSLML